jgi:hypothetical protein
MALPKINQPIYELTLPSTKKKVRYRPFTVAEEKLLMMAKEGAELSDIVNVYKQIINNCCVDTVDVDNLAFFDLEYFFIALRSKSVGNIVPAKVKDSEDNKEYNINIDLDKVQVSELKKNNVIKLTDTIGVVMKYPSFDALKYMTPDSKETESAVQIIGACIESIFEGDKFFEVSNSSQQEIDDFISSLGMKQMELLKEFFEEMPKVYVDVTYKREDGTEKTIKLEGIHSFF